ncbi:hypothetical protein LCGC14_2829300 [marine sediment metagenome]|uniref:Uncharacterized protein n=1 Tax=marine sediment metagenome TaxID=412755 RepID=A0A0F9B5Q4_9ZZZZ|nr:hypothetical protein [Candidatus Scalindua sp.]
MRKKPTIDELEKILNGPPCKIRIKPDGSLETELDDDVVCPFCSEKGFDLEGLKTHYELGWCEKYNETKRLR